MGRGEGWLWQRTVWVQKSLQCGNFCVDIVILCNDFAVRVACKTEDPDSTAPE